MKDHIFEARLIYQAKLHVRMEGEKRFHGFKKLMEFMHTKPPLQGGTRSNSCTEEVGSNADLKESLRTCCMRKEHSSLLTGSQSQ